MNRKLAQLAERRQQLAAKAAAQRTAVALEMEPWHARLALADRGMAVFQYVRQHPAVILGPMLLLAAFRPRHAGKWLQRGWMAWQFGRKLRGFGRGKQ
jgi:hypothetical protein